MTVIHSSFRKSAGFENVIMKKSAKRKMSTGIRFRFKKQGNIPCSDWHRVSSAVSCWGLGVGPRRRELMVIARGIRCEASVNRLIPFRSIDFNIFVK